MSALSDYKLTFESLEDEKSLWRKKTAANQSYKAERASRLGSMAREMGHSLKSNIIRRIKGDNAR
jgi:hypothetical protein